MFNLIDRACVRLLEIETLPNFDADYAKVISHLSKNQSLSESELRELTGIQNGRLNEVLAELIKLSFVYVHESRYCLADKWEVINTLISFAEAKIKAEEKSEINYAVTKIRK